MSSGVSLRDVLNTVNSVFLRKGSIKDLSNSALTIFVAHADFLPAHMLPGVRSEIQLKSAHREYAVKGGKQCCGLTDSRP